MEFNNNNNNNNSDNRDQLMPRSIQSRPSILSSHSWPRIPAVALTTPSDDNDNNSDHYSQSHHLAQSHYIDNNTDDTDDIVDDSYDSNSVSTLASPAVILPDVKDDGVSEMYEKQDPSSPPGKNNSADTLVEAMLGHAEAQDRHVRFQEHVATSAALVQKMLGDTGSQTPIGSTDHTTVNNSSSPTQRHPSRSDIVPLDRRSTTRSSSSCSHPAPSSSARGLANSPPSQTATTYSGSVLASLMKLETQRRQHHEKYIMNEEIKQRKKLEKAQERTEKQERKKQKKSRPFSTPSCLNLKGDHLGNYTVLEGEWARRQRPSNSNDNNNLPDGIKDDSGRPVGRPKLARPTSWLSTMSTGQQIVPRLDQHNLTTSNTTTTMAAKKLHRYGYPKKATTRKHKAKGRQRKTSMSSLKTTASQFDPLTLEDRVRITFEIANILQKQDFLKKLAKALMLYGCPAHRLEYAMHQVATTLRVDAEFIYLPNIMLISCFDSATHTTETHFVRSPQTFDMDKLGEVYRLEKLVAHGEVSVDEALEFIDRIGAKGSLYPVWVNPWVYACCSFSGCVMFFGGRWKEGGVAAALAMVFAVYEVISGRFQSFQPIWEIAVCIVIGITAQGLMKYDFCFTPVAFSAIIVVLPGYGMAIAIQELVSRQLVSGVVRMVYAIIYSFLLGYGVSMGSALYQTIDPGAPPTNSHCVNAASSTTAMASQSQWFNFLTVPLFALGYCMFVRAKPHRWLTMTIVAACGFTVNYSLHRWARAPSQVLQVAPSFVLGMLGHLLTKVTGQMSFDAVLLGIFYLVPSSLGVKAALGLFGNSSTEVGTQGAGFALAMIEASIGITVGLFLATLVVYPKGTQHTPLMTF